ncbi:hypothetical protein BU17DRAFT_66343 [Hysterangium stoloniferum]|nr:hypothetical protein BU17DRAFT_66343 [Hysterangium stoloniferum]
MITHTVLVAIPNCVAIHELGKTSIPLTTGTLSLIKHPSSTEISASPIAVEIQSPPQNDKSLTVHTNKPALTLQIEKLAFPLMKDTLFGTDVNAPGSYLFVPELGPAEDASERGYVRITLPEEAQIKAGEGDMSFQDVFERELITVGLLKEGWAAMTDEVQRSVKSAVEGTRDKVSSALATETGRVPPEAIVEDEG